MGYAILKLVAITFTGSLLPTDAENQYNHWEIYNGLRQVSVSPDRHESGIPYCSAPLLRYKEDCILPMFWLIETYASEGHCLQKAYYGPARDAQDPDPGVFQNYNFWFSARCVSGQFHSKITEAHSNCVKKQRDGSTAFSLFGFTQASRQCYDCLRSDFLTILDGYVSPEGRSHDRNLYASIDYSPNDFDCPKLKFSR